MCAFLFVYYIFVSLLLLFFFLFFALGFCHSSFAKPGLLSLEQKFIFFGSKYIFLFCFRLLVSVYFCCLSHCQFFFVRSQKGSSCLYLFVCHRERNNDDARKHTEPTKIYDIYLPEMIFFINTYLTSDAHTAHIFFDNSMTFWFFD